MLDLCGSQVLRRPSYRGGVELEHTLPMDAASVMGVALVVGSVLPAHTLPSQALQVCCETLASLEEFAKFSSFIVISRQAGVSLSVTENKIDFDEFLSACKQLGIDSRRTPF